MRVTASMVGLILSAYLSMGDGGCSTSNSENKTFSFYRQDVCGSNAPFYWKADKVGRKYKIEINVINKYDLFKEGEYSTPILLPCPDSADAIYIVYEFHD